MSSDLSNPIFHDAEKVRGWLETRIWGNGRFCPHCGAAPIARRAGQDESGHWLGSLVLPYLPAAKEGPNYPNDRMINAAASLRRLHPSPNAPTPSKSKLVGSGAAATSPVRTAQA